MKVAKDNNNEDAVKDSEDTPDEARQEEEEDPKADMLEDDDIREPDEGSPSVWSKLSGYLYDFLAPPASSVANKEILTTSYEMKVAKDNNKDAVKDSEDTSFDEARQEEEDPPTDMLKDGDIRELDNENVETVIMVSEEEQQQHATPSILSASFESSINKKKNLFLLSSNLLDLSKKKEKKRMYLGSMLALAHKKVSNNKDDKSTVEREELVDAEEDVVPSTYEEGDYNESVKMVMASDEQPAQPSTTIQSGFTTMYKKLDPKKKLGSMLATSKKKTHDNTYYPEVSDEVRDEEEDTNATDDNALAQMVNFYLGEGGDEEARYCDMSYDSDSGLTAWWTTNNIHQRLILCRQQKYEL